MIKITNGVEIHVVTNGAFENCFKNQGFRKLEDMEAKETDIATEEVAAIEEFVDTAEVKAEDIPVAEEAKVEEAVEETEVELTQKPISEWTKTEIKEFAKANGINLKGKSIDEAREAIAAVVNTAEE